MLNGKWKHTVRVNDEPSDGGIGLCNEIIRFMEVIKPLLPEDEHDEIDDLVGQLEENRMAFEHQRESKKASGKFPYHPETAYYDYLIEQEGQLGREANADFTQVIGLCNAYGIWIERFQTPEPTTDYEKAMAQQVDLVPA